MNKTKVVIALLALNLIAIIYFGNSIGKKINEFHSQTQSSIQHVQNNVMWLENNIISGIGNQLIAQSNKVEQFDYKLLDVDSDNKQATVEVTVTLEEVSRAAEVSMVYTAAEGAGQNVAILTNQGGLTYGAELKLSLEHNYEFDVVESSEAVGQRKLNAAAQRLPLFDDFYTSRVYYGESGTSIHEDRLEAHFSYMLKNLGLDKAEMEQVVVHVFYRNELIDEVDATGKVQKRSGSYRHIQDHYNVALASGQIDQSVSLEQFGRDNGYDLQDSPDDDPNYLIEHTIVFAEDYTELELDRESASQLSFQLSIKFKDGYVHHR